MVLLLTIRPKVSTVVVEMISVKRYICDVFKIMFPGDDSINSWSETSTWTQLLNKVLDVGGDNVGDDHFPMRSIITYLRYAREYLKKFRSRIDDRRKAMLHPCYTALLTQSGDGKTSFAWILMMMGYPVCYVSLSKRSGVSIPFKMRFEFMGQPSLSERILVYFDCWLRHVSLYGDNWHSEMTEFGAYNCLLHVLYSAAYSIDRRRDNEDTTGRLSTHMSRNDILPVLFIDEFTIFTVNDHSASGMNSTETYLKDVKSHAG